MMYKDFLQLIRFDKPIGTLLLLWPTLGALFIAAHGVPPVYTIIVFSLGVFLTRSAGCAINDVFDANFDKHVLRTKNRPIASGRVSKKQGIIFSMGLTTLAFIMAALNLHSNTLWFSLPALIIFITYPLMKRFFFLPQAYLGVAFSFGILMAFTEVIGQINQLAWILFIANICWVLGYDTIYALQDKKDDLHIGIKTSAITLGQYVVLFIAICYTIFSGLFLLTGIMLKLNILYYLALTLSSSLLIYQIITLIKMEKHCYARLFLINNWVGFLLFIGIVIGLN